MQPCFSIIIPVYNVAAYLEQCVQSVIAALIPADEIILVCGKSNDKSNEVSRSLQKRYENVHIIMQTGVGPSNARNCGLHEAKGTFVLFVDGDDFVDSNAMCNLLNEIRGLKYPYDVLVTNFYRYNQNTGQSVLIQQFSEERIVGLEQIMNSLHRRECFWNVWRYVYRKDFLSQNNILFWENVYAEDLDFTINVFIANPTICFVPVAYYYYRLGREGSLMNRTPVVRVISTLNVIEKDIGLLSESQTSWRQKMIEQLQFEYILNMALICELPKENQENAVRLIKIDVLNSTTDLAIKAIKLMLRTLGVHTTASFLSKLKRLKRKKEGRTL